MHKIFYVLYTNFVFLLFNKAVWVCVFLFSVLKLTNRLTSRGSFLLEHNIQQTNIYSGLLSCDTDGDS